MMTREAKRLYKQTRIARVMSPEKETPATVSLTEEAPKAPNSLNKRFSSPLGQVAKNFCMD